MTGAAGASDDSPVGRVLLGRYRIVRKLAEGGMGIVYLARVEGAAGFRKPVVLKQVLPSFSQRPHYMGMFVREAQILAQLRHPGIVDVIELGEHDGGYVMVLEYVAGYNLGQWSAYRRKIDDPIPTELCIFILIGVLDALHHVHTQLYPDGTALHITHRDVSPSNVLLDTDGFAKLVDFGVARMEVDTLYRTEGRGFRGKLAYSAPELFDGADATPQTDVYAAGVVLHELLIGKNELAGVTQAETLQRAMSHAPSSVHGVRDDAPEDIDAILGRALAKQRGDRYASASEFAHALRRTLRTPEPVLRERLAAALRADFGGDMATVLGIESLVTRDRAWRRFSTAPPPLEEAAPKVLLLDGADAEQPGIHEQPTRVSRVRAGDDTDAPEDPPTVATDDAATEAGAREQSPARATTRRLPFAFVGAAVLVLAAVALALVLLRGTPPQRVVVLQPAPATPPTPAAPAAPVPAGGAVAPATAEATAPPAPRAAPTRGAPARRDPSAAALTNAFRRKQRAIEACYARQPDAPQTEIVFRIDAAGRVLDAAVLPQEVAATSLGLCLSRVARDTRFPSQAQALSFRIPVTAKRVAQAQ